MGRRPAKVLELDMLFEEAVERFIRVDPAELIGRQRRSKGARPKPNKQILNAKKPTSKSPKKLGSGSKGKGVKKTRR